jgi:dTDP-4-amino-4,6-dideoxygalactose transaminase
MAYLLLDLKPGDEVLLPSFTFPSTANAFVLRGAKPRFIDIRPDTLNLDECLIESHLTKATKAIGVVHYAGVPCEMDVITKIARKRHLWIVEDAAQALGAKYKGRFAGTLGDIGAFSFHETKNVICGEGGGTVLKTSAHVSRGEIIRQKGTNRNAFFRGEVDKYSWVDVGSSFVMSELQAAFLFSQLQNIDAIKERRKRLFEYYWEGLEKFRRQGKIRLPIIPDGCESSHHLFHVIFENESQRDGALEHFKRNGIYAVRHFVPLHLSKMGRQFGYRKGQFPVSEEAGQCLLRLPLFNRMKRGEVDRVISVLSKYLN